MSTPALSINFFSCISPNDDTTDCVNEINPRIYTHIASEKEEKVVQKTVEEQYVRTMGFLKFSELAVKITSVDTQQELQVVALIDSGASGLYVDKMFIHENHLNTHLLAQEIPVFNVYGTWNNTVQGQSRK